MCILRESMGEFQRIRIQLHQTTLNMWKKAASENLEFGHIYCTTILANITRETYTMAPSYAQNRAKDCQIHTTVNLPFKRPLHEGDRMHDTTIADANYLGIFLWIDVRVGHYTV